MIISLSKLGGQAEGLSYSSRGHRPRNRMTLELSRPVRVLQRLCVSAPLWQKSAKIAKRTQIKNRNTLSTNNKRKNPLASFSKTNPFTINITRSIANHRPGHSPSPWGEGRGEGELIFGSGRKPALTIILAPEFRTRISFGPLRQIKPGKGKSRLVKPFSEQKRSFRSVFHLCSSVAQAGRLRSATVAYGPSPWGAYTMSVGMKSVSIRVHPWLRSAAFFLAPGDNRRYFWRRRFQGIYEELLQSGKKGRH